MEFRFFASPASSAPPTPAATLRMLDGANAELVACGMWQDERPLRGLCGLVDWRLAGRLSQLAKTGFLTGALGEVLLVPGKPALPFEKILVVGTGARAAFDEGAFRAATRKLLSALEGMRVRRAVVELPGRAGAAIAPERATEIVMDLAGASEGHDAWWLVDDPAAQKKLKERAADERRRGRRGSL
jgi:hypothetical protein